DGGLTSSYGTVSSDHVFPGFTDASWGTTERLSFPRVRARAVRLVFDSTSFSGSSHVGQVGEVSGLAADGAAGPRRPGADRADRVCVLGPCAAPSCSAGVQNGLETDVGCGGGCPACAPGRRCSAPGDCSTGVCVFSACQAASCAGLECSNVFTPDA